MKKKEPKEGAKSERFTDRLASESGRQTKGFLLYDYYTGCHSATFENYSQKNRFLDLFLIERTDKRHSD